MQTRLGSTIVIANPTAHSGKGGHAAELTGHFFESYTSATDNFNLCLTTRAGEATEIAGAAGGTDTVVALGGDGVIHEVINGLMRISPDARPRLGVIAMGSGNDFARTLGVPFNDPEESLHSLLRAQETSYDLGLVDAGTPDARYFMETLSFGLDAAIRRGPLRDLGHKDHESGTSGLAVSCRTCRHGRYQTGARGDRGHLRHPERPDLRRRLPHRPRRLPPRTVFSTSAAIPTFPLPTRSSASSASPTRAGTQARDTSPSTVSRILRSSSREKSLPRRSMASASRARLIP